MAQVGAANHSLLWGEGTLPVWTERHSFGLRGVAVGFGGFCELSINSNSIKLQIGFPFLAVQKEATREKTVFKTLDSRQQRLMVLSGDTVT